MSTKNQRGPRRVDISRREFLRMAGVGSSALLLAACGGTPVAQDSPTAAPVATTAGEAATSAPVTTAGEAATSAPAAASGATTKLTFWTPGGSQVFCPTMWTNIMNTYSKANPQISFEEIQCGTGDQAFEEVLLARIAAGNPPDATILWVSPIALGARGSLYPLDEMMAISRYAQKENWPDAVLASCVFNGKTYGLPVAAGTYGIWYNQELFEKMGIPSEPKDFPKTWDELRRLSKEFVKWNGDTLESAGFIPWSDPNTIPIWSAANGGQIYDAKAQRYTIDSEQNVAMMEWVVSWLDEQYKGDITKVNASGSWGVYPGSEGQPPAFQEGRLAALLEGSWVMGDFYASTEPKFERWNLAQIPVGPQGTQAVSGYWPNWVVIPNGAKNVEAAFNWLDYIAGEGVKTWYTTIPDMPTNKLVSLDNAPGVVVEKRGQKFAQETAQFFKSQLDIATPMWDSPVQNFATDQLSRALEQIINKASAPKDALAEAQQVTQAELEKTLKGSA